MPIWLCAVCGVGALVVVFNFYRYRDSDPSFFTLVMTLVLLALLLVTIDSQDVGFSGWVVLATIGALVGPLLRLK